MSNTITITGGLGQDPELRFTPSGTPVLNGSVADTPRRYDKDLGDWVDAGDTLWLNWSIFGPDAEDLTERLRKGTRVTIIGRLKARTFTTKSGDQRTVNEITADSVAVHAPKQGAGWPNKPEQTPRGGDDPWASNNSRAPF